MKETNKEEIVRLRGLVEAQDDLIASVRTYFSCHPIFTPDQIVGYMELLHQITYLKVEGHAPKNYVLPKLPVEEDGQDEPENSKPELPEWTDTDDTGHDEDDDKSGYKDEF